MKKTIDQVWSKFYHLLNSDPVDKDDIIELVGEFDNIFDQLIEYNVITEHQRQNARLKARIKFNEDS